jgi:hemoglobin/transferrin/lactoferrin receptor protein
MSAQTAPASTPATSLSEIIVTATRIEQDVLSVPYTAQVIRRDDFVERRAVRTLADALGETPGIMVQRTSYGQASPFIRGFTGFRTLMLVDGIRLNNAVFRDGPNQYWGTIDALSVDHLDVVKGPTSVLYGSDAVGGTVNTITLLPAQLAFGPSVAGAQSPRQSNAYVRGSVYYRYASAENSHVTRGVVSAQPTASLGIIAGLTFRDFDDLRGGKSTGVQPMSGYRENSGDLKLTYRPAGPLRVTAAYQRVRQDDVPRTHATIHGKSFAGTSLGTDWQRNLDQSRDLTYVQLELLEPGSWLQQANVSVSWHRQAEEQDRIRSNGRREITGFVDDQYGVQVNLISPGVRGRWAYGVEYYCDHVSSFGTDTQPGRAPRILPRGPVADDARYRLLGLYVQRQIRLTGPLELTAGLRYTSVAARADKVDPDPTDAFPFGTLDERSDAITASLRAKYDLKRAWNLFGGVSQGFRAPNISDYTSFELARSGERETPALDLSPEKFISFELGSKARLAGSGSEFYGALFHTRIENQITRFPTGRFIQTEREVSKANTGDGFVQGVELGASVTAGRGWSVHGNLTWAEGEVDTFVDRSPIRKPASRIQPLTALVSPRWRSRDGRRWFDATAQVVLRQDRLSPGDVEDAQRIPPGGTPGFAVYGVRSGWRVQPAVTLTAAVENVLNRDYRIHGSGINEPGINFVASVHVDY